MANKPRGTRKKTKSKEVPPAKVEKVRHQWTWDKGIGVAGGIAGILGTAFGLYAIFDNRSMAHENGSMRKSVVSLAFDDKLATEMNNTLIALIPRSCKAKPILMELPFTLANTGDKSTSELTLTVGYPFSQGVSIAGTEAINPSFALGGPPVLGKFDRHVTDSEPYRYIQYKWDAVFPKTSVTVSEPISAPLPMVISAHEIQPDLSGNVVVSYQYRLPVIITTEHELSTGSLTVGAIEAENISEAMPAIKKYIGNQFPRHSARPWYDIRGWFIPNIHAELFVTEPGNVHCGSPNGSFVFVGAVTKLEFNL